MRLTRNEHLYFDTCAKAVLACPEVQSMRAFIQHGRVSCLEHSLSVAYYSYWLCRRLHLRVDGDSLIRGALLHDFFLYDWHTARAAVWPARLYPSPYRPEKRPAALPPERQGGECHRQPYVASDASPPPPVQGSLRCVPHR